MHGLHKLLYFNRLRGHGIRIADSVYHAEVAGNIAHCPRQGTLAPRTLKPPKATAKPYSRHILVPCIIHNCGYRRFNLMRASSVVKRQLMVAARLFRSSSQAATSFLIKSISGILRLRHWLLSALNSISATLSQLPCLGV